jgi:hypothetical protein
MEKKSRKQLIKVDPKRYRETEAKENLNLDRFRRDAAVVRQLALSSE